ncbi:g7632 [Coccomyxa elongata]
MFHALGDKVEYWTTFNEPASFCFMGYGGGYGGLSVYPPAIHDAGHAAKCTINVLKAHAAAVEEFRKIVPGGKISMNLNSDWAIPFHENDELDKGAAQRRLDFTLGLFADPVYLGQFPDSVRARVPYLPEITPELATALNGSCDYFALNHYTTVSNALMVSRYARYDPNGREPLGLCEYAISHEKDGVLLGVPAGAGWIYSVPWGFRELLKYINERYKPTEISVTENTVFK